MWDLAFRPLNFTGIVGNDAIKVVLRKRFQNRDSASRSLMFGGPKGSGKTTFARIVARAFVCESLEDGNPCNLCSSCNGVLGGSSLSVMEFDAASSGSVEKIRSIVDSLEYQNMDGNPTIIILDEAHRLGPAAQDALLTAMEDRRIIAIFCTTEPNKIRPALRDRLDEFSVRYPNYHDVEHNVLSCLKSKNITIDSRLIYMAAEALDNCPRNIWNALYFCYSEGVFDENLLKSFLHYQSMNMLKLLLRDVRQQTADLYKIFDDLVALESAEWVRQNIIKFIAMTKRKTLGLPHKPIFTFSMSSEDIMYFDALCLGLVGIDKVSPAELEMKLFYPSVSAGVILPAPKVESVGLSKQEVPYTIKSSAKPDLASAPKPGSGSIEIEGVRFNAEERIVKLHDKIESSRGAPTALPEENAFSIVQYERTKIPMSDQEFSRAFIERFKSP